MGATDLSIVPNREVILPTTVFRAGAATDVPLIIQGTTSQTGDLLQIKDVNGNILTRIDSNGTLDLNGRIDFTRHFLFGGNT